MAQTLNSPGSIMGKEALTSPPAETQTDTDPRESLAESLVIPRDSFFNRPPTPPPKDPPKTAPEPMGPPDKHSRPGTSKTIPPNGTAVTEPVDVDVRQSMATSGTIKIAATASMLNGQGKGPVQNTKVMSTIHPLAMSPPSPLPSTVPKMPRRPARPASLRLSSFSSRTGLTTDKIVTVDSNKSRPGTSYSQKSSQPHTGITNTTRGLRAKYGRGKYATTELVPQPSDDCEDPLNWPTWRKELNFYSILMTVSMVNVMKTALISVNAVLASQLSCSYMAAVALTGVPLMLSAGTGIASVSFSKLWGRRPVYLVSMILLFIGLVWNTQVSSSYAQFMAARIFQGLGWGAFDALMPGTILDTYFEHERPKKMGVYRILSAATLWGSPLLGGLTAQHQQGPTLPFAVLAIFQVVSVPLLVLGAPESMYDRLPLAGEKPTPSWSPRTGWSSLGLQSSNRYYARVPAWARGRGLTLDRAIQYVKSVARPQSYCAPGLTQEAGRTVDTQLLKQPFRALVAPTTLLAFLASFLPHSMLWGFAFSLSGLFARAPFQLFPATVGSLFATSLVFSALVAGVFSFWPAWSKTLAAFQTPSTHLFVLGVGAFLSFVGLLAFGLYVGAHVSTTTPVADANDTPDIRFSALSFIIGLLAAGAYTLQAPRSPLVFRSTQFTSPNLAVTLRNVADMEAAVTVWHTLFAGVFMMGIPAATVISVTGLRNTGIGVAVIQVFVVVGVGAAWYLLEEVVWRWDGRILRCAELRYHDDKKGARSYFELDD